MSEVKYAMRYIRKCRGGRFFNGVSFFMQILFLLIALVVTWLSVFVKPDMTIDSLAMFLIYMPAACYLSGISYGTAQNLIDSMGKGFLCTPLAKTALTKGLLVTNQIKFLTFFLPCAGLRLVGFLLKNGSERGMDDFLVFFGIAYVLSIVSMVSTLVSILTMGSFVWGCVLFTQFKNLFWEMSLQVPVAVVLFVGLLILGSLLAPVVMDDADKKRTLPDRIMDELVQQAYRLKKDRR